MLYWSIFMLSSILYLALLSLCFKDVMSHLWLICLEKKGRKWKTDPSSSTRQPHLEFHIQELERY